VGGLLGGAPQTGKGFFYPIFNPRKPIGGGYMGFLFKAGKGIAETFSGQKAPGSFKNGKFVLDKKAIPQSNRGSDSFVKGLSRDVGFTGVRIIPQLGRDVKRVKRVKCRKKQKGKGFITDLLKTEPNKP
jgi:hypothetical protein